MEIKVEYKNSKKHTEWQEFGTLTARSYAKAIKFLMTIHGAQVYRLNGREFVTR